MLKKGSSLDIRTVPSAICGDPKIRHGIILAKSIPAKKYNIQTGETIYTALKKCPSLKLYQSDYQLYENYHFKFISLLKKYFPIIEVASIDECYINYSCVKKLYGDEVEFAKKIKEEIYEKLGFTVNVGIGENKFLAKTASDFSKPNKVHTLYNYEIPEKLWPLDIKEMYGVGKKSYEKLSKLGFKTIYDIANNSKHYLYKILGKQGVCLFENANGKGSTYFETNHVLKSISASETLAYDIENIEDANLELLKLSERLGKRLRENDSKTSVISIEIKSYTFEKFSKQRKLTIPISCTNDIYSIAKSLFKEAWDKTPIRNLGISLSGFKNINNEQLTFFNLGNSNIKEDNEKKIILDRVIDKINEKYNSSILTRACFIQKKK